VGACIFRSIFRKEPRVLEIAINSGVENKRILHMWIVWEIQADNSI
jgi:hypothetical protein